MNEQEGLAGMQQGPQVNVGMLEQVIQMLMAGTTEAQLLQMGVPQEVIEAAIAELGIQQQQQVSQDVGLAAAQGLV